MERGPASIYHFFVPFPLQSTVNSYEHTSAEAPSSSALRAEGWEHDRDSEGKLREAGCAKASAILSGFLSYLALQNTRHLQVMSDNNYPELLKVFENFSVFSGFLSARSLLKHPRRIQTVKRFKKFFPHSLMMVHSCHSN